MLVLVLVLSFVYSCELIGQQVSFVAVTTTLSAEPVALVLVSIHIIMTRDMVPIGLCKYHLAGFVVVSNTSFMCPQFWRAFDGWHIVSLSNPCFLSTHIQSHDVVLALSYQLTA